MNYFLRREGWGDETVPLIMANMKSPIEDVLTINGDTIKAGYVFRWGTTASLDGYKQGGVVKVVNTRDAIHAGFEKPLARIKFMKAGILTPEVWLDVDEAPRPSPKTPLVVRPYEHQRGENMTLVDTPRKLIQVFDKLKNAYIQPFIPKVKEYRVHVAQGRVMSVTEKLPKDREALAWGVDNVTYENVRWGQWPLDVVSEAIAASNLLGYHFSAVDVIVDKDGSPFVLECNSAPQLSFYEAETYARAFDYIIKHGRKPIPLGKTKDWRSLIHPSNTKDAA